MPTYYTTSTASSYSFTYNGGWVPYTSRSTQYSDTTAVHEFLYEYTDVHELLHEYQGNIYRPRERSKDVELNDLQDNISLKRADTALLDDYINSYKIIKRGD